MKINLALRKIIKESKTVKGKNWKPLAMKALFIFLSLYVDLADQRNSSLKHKADYRRLKGKRSSTFLYRNKSYIAKNLGMHMIVVRDVLLLLQHCNLITISYNFKSNSKNFKQQTMAGIYINTQYGDIRAKKET